MLEQCVVYREQLLIVAGVVIIVAQVIIGRIERRHYRNTLKRYRMEEDTIHDTDRT